MALLCLCEEFNAWQTQVLELDGQGGVTPVASSPRSKSAADCECLESLSRGSLPTVL
jgi:hypothetical protein